MKKIKSPRWKKRGVATSLIKFVGCNSAPTGKRREKAALHDRIPRASAPFWDGPVDILLRHLDRATLAVDAVLSVDHLFTSVDGWARSERYPERHVCQTPSWSMHQHSGHRTRENGLPFLCVHAVTRCAVHSSKNNPCCHTQKKSDSWENLEEMKKQRNTVIKANTRRGILSFLEHTRT